MNEVSSAPATSKGAATAGPRFLHTMLRVFDLDRSLTFYTEQLGMKLIRKKDYPSGEFTLAFVGYGDEADSTVIELTHNWGQKEPYAIGSGYYGNQGAIGMTLRATSESGRWSVTGGASTSDEGGTTLRLGVSGVLW